LIAFGEHRREDGRVAMQEILDNGASFTGLIASNDLYCLGAMEVLRASGKNIPADVAVIGFDDILEAHSQNPLLTTVHHPTFTLGYQSVLSVLAAINGNGKEEINTRVKTQLVIRQSCGCRPESSHNILIGPPSILELESTRTSLAHLMADAAFIEVRHSPRGEIEVLCQNFLNTFISSLKGHDTTKFDADLEQLFEWIEKHGEDTYAWNAAFSILRSRLPNLLSADSGSDPIFADALIDRARLVIAEITQRQTTDRLLRHMEMSNRLGLMTSQLLAAMDVKDIAAILAQHLPQLGIRHALVALYSVREDDPF
jgi:hypothetical protein